MSNEDIFVYGFWTIATLLAMSVIGYALRAGFRGNQQSLRGWRLVKLWSALLGVVGLALLLIGFEDLARGSLRAGSKEWAEDRFLEVKLLVAHEMAVSCAKESAEAQMACGLLKNINNQLYIDRIRRGEEIRLVTDWQRGRSISVEFQEEINRLLGSINGASTRSVRRSAIDEETRVRVVMFAVILLIVGIAGSVGEAAYQYRMAKG